MFSTTVVLIRMFKTYFQNTIKITAVLYPVDYLVSAEWRSKGVPVYSIGIGLPGM